MCALVYTNAKPDVDVNVIVFRGHLRDVTGKYWHSVRNCSMTSSALCAQQCLFWSEKHIFYLISIQWMESLICCQLAKNSFKTLSVLWPLVTPLCCSLAAFLPCSHHFHHLLPGAVLGNFIWGHKGRRGGGGRRFCWAGEGFKAPHSDLIFCIPWQFFCMSRE